MKCHVFLTLILFGLLSGSTMTLTPVSYAGATVIIPPNKCIISNRSNTIHGILAGTQVNYTITMPKNWNGTLLLFSHMYISPLDAPPNPAPVATDSFTADELLKEG